MTLPLEIARLRRLTGLGALGEELNADQAQLDVADAQGRVSGLIDLMSQLRQVDTDLYGALAPEVEQVAREMAELEAQSNQANQGSGLVSQSWRTQYESSNAHLESLRERAQHALTTGRGSRESRVFLWTSASLLVAGSVTAAVFWKRRSRSRR